MQSKNPNSLLVTVQDGASALPLPDTLVTLQSSATTTGLTTGQGFLRQINWTGGGGQAAFTDATKYFSASGMDTTSATNGMKLQNVFGTYVASSTLISSTFDSGSASNFYQLSWLPQTQPTQTGASSVQFQIATNNDDATWNFAGPDGTANTYYTSGNGNVSPVNNGNRYLRYKAYLQTANTAYTPSVSGVSVTFTSTCTPLGQVFFTGMPSDTYSITVSKSGYQTYTGTVSLSSSWQTRQVSLQAL
jgi:hypothetical protein